MSLGTFAKQYGHFWVHCWGNPYWYVAVLFFCVGPFTNSFPPPWWAAIYVPAMLLFISIMVVMLQIVEQRKRTEVGIKS